MTHKFDNLFLSLPSKIVITIGQLWSKKKNSNFKYEGLVLSDNFLYASHLNTLSHCF